MKPAGKATAKLPPPFVSQCLLLLTPLGPVTPRAMFGGWGFFLDGVMIALIARDQLYFKVDGETVERFAAAGSEPFVYGGKIKPIAMSYWRAPEGSLDDPQAMLPWGALAVAAARRAATKKAGRKQLRKTAALR